MERIGMVLVLLAVAGCGAPDYRPNTRTQPVSRETYGSDWPFTVVSGELDCPQPGAVVFRSGGKVYALNGTAASTGKYRPIEEILATGKAGQSSTFRLADDGLRLCTD